MVRLGYTYSQPGLGDFGNTGGKKKKEDNITQNTTKNNQLTGLQKPPAASTKATPAATKPATTPPPQPAMETVYNSGRTAANTGTNQNQGSVYNRQNTAAAAKPAGQPNSSGVKNTSDVPKPVTPQTQWKNVGSTNTAQGGGYKSYYSYTPQSSNTANRPLYSTGQNLYPSTPRPPQF